MYVWLLDKVASSPVEVEENVAVRNEMLREQRRNIRGLVTVTATTAAVVPVQEELASNSPTSSRRLNELWTGDEWTLWTQAKGQRLRWENPHVDTRERPLK
jgi:hypothetical protein